MQFLRHCYAILIPAIAACGSATDSSAFNVRASVFTSLNTGGCSATWQATASDSAVIVNYQLGTYANTPDTTYWLSSGTFRSSETLSYDMRLVTEAHFRWIVSAGTWAKDKHIAVTCGNQWREP